MRSNIALGGLRGRARKFTGFGIVFQDQAMFTVLAGVGAMAPETLDALKGLAAKYIWWKTPDQAIAAPERVIAQVMDIGDYGDVQWLAGRIGENGFRDVLARAEPGWLSERSWTYWCYRLGLASLDHVPPPPSRRFA